MNTDNDIVQNDSLTGAQVEALRAFVGWDHMSGRYDAILHHSFMHFSIKDGTQLIGFVNVISDGIADAFIVDLMVHPRYQRQGLGRALVTHAIEKLTERGISCIQVIFDPELEPFYQRLGFHVLKAGIIDNSTADCSSGESES